MNFKNEYLFAVILVVLAVYIIFYIPSLAVEFFRNCIWEWPLEPFNEKHCIEEAKYNAMEWSKDKTENLLTI